MRLVHSSAFIGTLAALTLGLAACGGDDNKAEGDLGEQAQAACTGSPLTEAAKLPSSWPDMGEVTFTQQSTQGPTEVVEGYFDGASRQRTTSSSASFEAAGLTDPLRRGRGERFRGLVEGRRPIGPGRVAQRVR